MRTFEQVQEHRLTTTMEHLTDPEHKAYHLTMEELMLDVDFLGDDA